MFLKFLAALLVNILLLSGTFAQDEDDTFAQDKDETEFTLRSAESAISAAFRGKKGQFERTVSTKKINWKQGSFLGFGGDRSQTYKEVLYKIEGNDAFITVFIQDDWKVPDPLTLDSNLQYGLNNGDIFFVLHDKEQKPYQHRFKMTTLQSIAYYGNEVLKLIKGYDASWIAGDYLHNL
ncbi:uncharacterized protein [Amphiura filiformis]|uniref:uncharacterized protein n=1 Tax=Amphiura filiformis TaxID=82378 RepID=UPI003B21928E